MKLKMHSFDFESNTITFSVPPEVMRSNRWGNVPEGVDVDLSKVTGNNSLGLNYSPIIEDKPSVRCCGDCGAPIYECECN